MIKLNAFDMDFWDEVDEICKKNKKYLSENECKRLNGLYTNTGFNTSDCYDVDNNLITITKDICKDLGHNWNSNTKKCEETEGEFLSEADCSSSGYEWNDNAKTFGEICKLRGGNDWGQTGMCKEHSGAILPDIKNRNECNPRWDWYNKKCIGLDITSKDECEEKSNDLRTIRSWIDGTCSNGKEYTYIPSQDNSLSTKCDRLGGRLLPNTGNFRTMLPSMECSQVSDEEACLAEDGIFDEEKKQCRIQEEPYIWSKTEYDQCVEDGGTWEYMYECKDGDTVIDGIVDDIACRKPVLQETSLKEHRVQINQLCDKDTNILQDIISRDPNRISDIRPATYLSSANITSRIKNKINYIN